MVTGAVCVSGLDLRFIKVNMTEGLFLCLVNGYSYFCVYEWVQLFLCLVNGSSYFSAYEWVQFFVPSECVQLFLCLWMQSATLATSPMPAASKITRGLVKAL